MSKLAKNFLNPLETYSSPLHDRRRQMRSLSFTVTVELCRSRESIAPRLRNREDDLLHSRRIIGILADVRVSVLNYRRNGRYKVDVNQRHGPARLVISRLGVRLLPVLIQGPDVATRHGADVCQLVVPPPVLSRLYQTSALIFR